MVDKFNFEFGNPDLPAFQNVKFEFEEVFVPFYRRYFYDKGAHLVIGLPDLVPHRQFSRSCQLHRAQSCGGPTCAHDRDGREPSKVHSVELRGPRTVLLGIYATAHSLHTILALFINP